MQNDAKGELKNKVMGLGDVAALQTFEAALAVGEIVSIMQGLMEQKRSFNDTFLKKAAGAFQYFNGCWQAMDKDVQNKIKPILVQVIGREVDIPTVYKYSGAI